jgi:hypothetical protein
MKPAASAEVPPSLRPLAQLVIKQGVALGGLPPAQQAWALALVWAGLSGNTLDEPGINRALKAQLAGPAAFLRTDHVELRRWLVDAGWLQRDGYGRAYQRTRVDALPGTMQALAQVLCELDAPAWAQAQRQAQAAARAGRRAAWQDRMSGDATGTGA